MVQEEVLSPTVQLDLSQEFPWGDLEWSPDGERLAFQSGSAYYIVEINTGEVRTLTTTAPMSYTGGLHWLAENRVILGVDRELWVYDLTSDRAERFPAEIEALFIQRDYMGGFVAEVPVVSHDGRRGAVETYDGGEKVLVYDLETGALVAEIAAQRRACSIRQLVWSPDDRQLAFVELYTCTSDPFNPDKGSIFVVDLEGGEKHQVGTGIKTCLSWGR